MSSSVASGTAAAAAPGIKVKKATSPVVTAYLLAYNLLAAASWSYVLFLIVSHLATYGEKGLFTLYEPIHRALYFAQSLAILEVIHAALRLVPSPVATTALQVASRLMLVWGIFYPVPESRATWGFLLATLVSGRELRGEGKTAQLSLGARTRAVGTSRARTLTYHT